MKYNFSDMKHHIAYTVNLLNIENKKDDLAYARIFVDRLLL